MDENFAIRLCLNHRDPVGFEFLVRKYRREAFFHAISILGNQEDALDACQESFTRAFAALPKLSYLDQFYPWFYRILRNCCLNMIGKRKTIRKYQQNCQTEHHSNKDTEIDPSIIVEKEEEKREVWETLNRLNPESREILIMKYIKG